LAAVRLTYRLVRCYFVTDGGCARYLPSATRLWSFCIPPYYRCSSRRVPVGHTHTHRTTTVALPYLPPPAFYQPIRPSADHLTRLDRTRFALTYRRALQHFAGFALPAHTYTHTRLLPRFMQFPYLRPLRLRGCAATHTRTLPPYLRFWAVHHFWFCWLPITIPSLLLLVHRLILYAGSWLLLAFGSARYAVYRAAAAVLYTRACGTCAHHYTAYLLPTGSTVVLHALPTFATTPLYFPCRIPLYYRTDVGRFTTLPACHLYLPAHGSARYAGCTAYYAHTYLQLPPFCLFAYYTGCCYHHFLPTTTLVACNAAFATHGCYTRRIATTTDIWFAHHTRCYILVACHALDGYRTADTRFAIVLDDICSWLRYRTPAAYAALRLRVYHTLPFCGLPAVLTTACGWFYMRLHTHCVADCGLRCHYTLPSTGLTRYLTVYTVTCTVRSGYLDGYRYCHVTTLRFTRSITYGLRPTYVATPDGVPCLPRFLPRYTIPYTTFLGCTTWIVPPRYRAPPHRTFVGSFSCVSPLPRFCRAPAATAATHLRAHRYCYTAFLRYRVHAHLSRFGYVLVVPAVVVPLLPLPTLPSQFSTSHAVGSTHLRYTPRCVYRWFATCTRSRSLRRTCSLDGPTHALPAGRYCRYLVGPGRDTPYSSTLTTPTRRSATRFWLPTFTTRYCCALLVLTTPTHAVYGSGSATLQFYGQFAAVPHTYIPTPPPAFTRRCLCWTWQLVYLPTSQTDSGRDHGSYHPTTPYHCLPVPACYTHCAYHRYRTVPHTPRSYTYAQVLRLRFYQVTYRLPHTPLPVHARLVLHAPSYTCHARCAPVLVLYLPTTRSHALRGCLWTHTYYYGYRYLCSCSTPPHRVPAHLHAGCMPSHATAHYCCAALYWLRLPFLVLAALPWFVFAHPYYGSHTAALGWFACWLFVTTS